MARDFFNESFLHIFFEPQGGRLTVPLVSLFKAN